VSERRSLYRPAERVSLALTLAPLPQGAGDPTIRRSPEGWWLALATPEGAATLLLCETRDGVEARAWGDGADAALAGVPALLGAGDALDGFESQRHPVVAELHRRLAGLRLGATGRILDALVPTILGQKVTGLEARRAWRTLVTRHGEPAPGPAPAGMRVAPSAAAWRRVPSWEWHRAGVGPQRSDAVQRCVAVGDALERAARVDSAEAVRRLRSVPGIGIWSAHETVQRTHGDPDRVSVGDLHVSHRVGAALLGDPVAAREVDDAAMLELLEPWRGHRQRVVRLIETSTAAGLPVVVPERRGPRFTIPEHRAL